MRRINICNLLEQAINSNDGDHAAKLIQNALGIESDSVANYCFPKAWPNDREQRARISLPVFDDEALDVLALGALERPFVVIRFVGLDPGQAHLRTAFTARPSHN